MSKVNKINLKEGEQARAADSDDEEPMTTDFDKPEKSPEKSATAAPAEVPEEISLPPIPKPKAFSLEEVFSEIETLLPIALTSTFDDRPLKRLQALTSYALVKLLQAKA